MTWEEYWQTAYEETDSETPVTIVIENERPKGFLTTNEFGKKYGLSGVAVRQWIRRGYIQPLKIGRDDWVKEDTPRPTTGVSGRKPLTRC